MGDRMDMFEYIIKLCNDKLKLSTTNNDIKSVEKCQTLLLNFCDRLFFTKINMMLSYEILLFIGVPTDKVVNVYKELIDYRKIYNII